MEQNNLPDSPVLQGEDPDEKSCACAAEVAHESGPVGCVGEILGVDSDGHVVQRQDDDERYPHRPRQGSVDYLEGVAKLGIPAAY